MKKLVIVLCFLLLKTVEITAQVENTNILFLLDASFSMRKEWETKSKWTIAKETVVNISDSLIQSMGSTVNIGIRAYGHQSMPVANDCFDTQLLLPIKNNSIADIRNVLEGINPKGITPLAYSLEETKKDFNALKGKNLLILITDGAESCSGDPCYILKILMDNQVILKPFIIGLNIPIESLQAYNCLPTYIYNETSQKTFKANLQQSLNQFIRYTSLQINLLDDLKKPFHTNEVLLFYNEANELKYTYFHKKKDNKLSDTLYLEPAKYRIEVQTIPKIKTPYFSLNAQKHNVYDIPAANGTFDIYFENELHQKVENISTIPYLLKHQNEKDYIFQGTLGKPQNVLKGVYDIDILTLPPIQLLDQKIADKNINKIPIPAPGLLEINATLPIHGAIFIKNVDNLINIYSLKPNTSIEHLALQPGEYQIVYRISSERKMIKTKTITFTIKSQQSTKLSL